MSTITVELSVDEFTSVQKALEFRLDWLYENGEAEYGDDYLEIIDSYLDAIAAMRKGAMLSAFAVTQHDIGDIARRYATGEPVTMDELRALEAAKRSW